MACKCNQCGKFFPTEGDLLKIQEDHEIFDGCGSCQTDSFLMDLEGEDLDSFLKESWSELEDLPMNPETEELEVDFLHFEQGTKKSDIWSWFGATHSQGMSAFM